MVEEETNLDAGEYDYRNDEDLDETNYTNLLNEDGGVKAINMMKMAMKLLDKMRIKIKFKLIHMKNMLQMSMIGI